MPGSAPFADQKCCRYRKLDPDVLMMQSSEERHRGDLPGALNCARDRRVLLQREPGPNVIVIAGVCPKDAVSLGIASVLVSLAVLVRDRSGPNRLSLLVAFAGVLAVAIITMAINEPANIRFAAPAGLSDVETIVLLARWKVWHWIRVALGLLRDLRAGQMHLLPRRRQGQPPNTRRKEQAPSHKTAPRRKPSRGASLADRQ